MKHDILQWFPIVDKIPVDVSIQAGYTKLSSTFEMNDPSNTIAPPQANMDVTATTINLLVSKKILMFTPYFGVATILLKLPLMWMGNMILQDTK